jgi:hypothetical protein
LTSAIPSERKRRRSSGVTKPKVCQTLSLQTKGLSDLVSANQRSVRPCLWPNQRSVRPCLWATPALPVVSSTSSSAGLRPGCGEVPSTSSRGPCAGSPPRARSLGRRTVARDRDIRCRRRSAAKRKRRASVRDVGLVLNVLSVGWVFRGPPSTYRASSTGISSSRRSLGSPAPHSVRALLTGIER